MSLPLEQVFVGSCSSLEESKAKPYFLRSRKAVTSWNPTRILSLHRSVGSSTEPVRVETDQGGAYAKFPGNPAGTHTLTCEIIGGLAARFLGLRTFESAVIKVDERELVQFESGQFADAGSVYLSKYWDGMPWDGESETLKEVQNHRDAVGFIVLDTWLQNCDRYRAHGSNPIDRPDNIFLGRAAATGNKAHFEMVAMDHTHIMTCGRALTSFVTDNMGKMLSEAGFIESELEGGKE